MTLAPRQRFVAWVIVLIPAFFIVWHALASVLAAPVVFAAGEILSLWLPNLVDEYSLVGTDMLLKTPFGETAGRLVPLAQAEFQIGFNQDTRLLTYAIPFYAALHFASELDNPIERFGRGLLILWVFMIVGMICVSLKNLMVSLGTTAFDAGALPPPAAIALSYQFSVLIIPPVAPICLWAWEARSLPWLDVMIERASARLGKS